MPRALRGGGEAPGDVEDLPARGQVPGGARPAPRPAPRRARETAACLSAVRHDRPRRRLRNRRRMGGGAAPDAGRARRGARERGPAGRGRARVPALRDGHAAFPARGWMERLIGRSSSRRMEGSSSCAPRARRAPASRRTGRRAGTSPSWPVSTIERRGRRRGRASRAGRGDVGGFRVLGSSGRRALGPQTACGLTGDGRA